MKNSFKILFIVTLSCLIHNISCELKKEDCEVCFNVIDSFKAQYKNHLSDKDFVSKEFKKFCEAIALSDGDEQQKEKSFCYHVGGLEISATSSISYLSRVIKNYPTYKVCSDLDSQIGGICNLRYAKKFDLKSLSNEEIKKMKARDLKKILSSYGEECEDCIEKSDIVRLVLKLKEKQLKEEL